MPTKEKNPEVQALWDAYNESRAAIKAAGYKLFKVYLQYCMSKEKPRYIDNNLLGRWWQLRLSFVDAIYFQFQCMMDFDMICNIQRCLVSRTESSFFTNTSMQAWRDAIEMHIRWFNNVLLCLEHCVTPSLAISEDGKLKQYYTPSYNYISLVHRVPILRLGNA